MEETSVIIKSQNSAALLSIWHMVFSRFFKNCEKEYLDNKNEGLMEEMYKNLKALRLSITQAEDEQKKMDPKITQPFKELFEVVPSSRWIEEMNSMMKELKQTKKGLEFLKEYSSLGEIESSFHLQIDSSNNNQEQLESIYIPHLLTIWYWLTACWSSPINDVNNVSKDEFLEGVETNYDIITQLLFHKTIPEIQQPEDVIHLTSKVFEMFMSDPECWFDALDNFTLSMMQVGYGYQYVVEHAGSQYVVEHAGSPFRPVLTIGVFGSIVKWLPKLIPGIKKGAKGAAKAVVEGIADMIGQKISEEAGETAGKVIETVLDIATIAFTVNVDIDLMNEEDDDVAALALTTGEGMKKFVEVEGKYN